MKPSYDIVIHGAGIPGMTLALLLADLPAESRPSVLLLDRHAPTLNPAVHHPPESVADFDLRVFALTLASRQLFETVGVWPGDQAARVFPYQRMHVWDGSVAANGAGNGHIRFDAADTGTSALGYIIEGRVMADWLVQRIGQSKVEVCGGVELTRIERRVGGLSLQLNNGDSLHARLLVGADGAQSRVRQLAGLMSGGWSYGQTAIVATVETEYPHRATARQRFLPGGPLAFLPMHGPYCSIVWSVPDGQAPALCELSEAAFCERLGEAFAFHLGRIHAVGPRASFPLRMRHANHYIHERVALIADAAHTVHPLAGQGLNLGLLDTAALAWQLMQALKAGDDPGSHRLLRAYERSRKADNWLMQSAFAGLKSLFSNEQTLLRWLRTTGLGLVDHQPALKNGLVAKAMGLTGDVPPPARVGGTASYSD